MFRGTAAIAIKRPLILAALLAIISCYAFSQSSVWKISKDGNELYLGGSIHVLRQEDYPLPKEFDHAFEASSVLVLETDISRADDPLITERMLSGMFLDTGITLESMLGERAYYLLEKNFAVYGVPISAVNNMKPAMAVNLLSLMQIQNLGFIQQGVDMHYLSKALEAEMELGFLESLELQIELMMNMGNGYEDEYVLYSLSDFEQTGREIERLVSQWKKGNAKETELMILGMKESFPAAYDDLILKRNSAWVPLIEDYLKSPETEFIIAGLAHMYGGDGLLEALKKRGCIIEQVKLR